MQTNHLQAMRLMNFKCFQDQKVSLAPLTLLTGLNGMGKSTVLQSLLLLRQSAVRNVLEHYGLLLNGDLVNLGRAGDVLFEGARDEHIVLELTVGGMQESWKFRYEDPYADVLMLEEGPRVLPEWVIFGNRFHYLAAERMGPREIYEISAYYVRSLRQLGADGRFAVAYLEEYGKSLRCLQRLLHPKTSDSTEENLFSQVNLWLGEISPGARLEPISFPDIGKTSLRVSFPSSTKGLMSRPYSTPNVGFGFSYTLPVLVAVLSSSSGDLVLMENPEAHLHPQGQVALGRLFALAASGGIQLLVETHSDHILNGVRVAVKDGCIAGEDVRIHFFQRNHPGGQHFVESPRVDKDGRIDNWPEGFFDQTEHLLMGLI